MGRSNHSGTEPGGGPAIEQAAAGEEIVIAKAGRPRARLLPIATGTRRRKAGAWQGKGWIAADFDDPLPAKVR